MDDLDTGGGTSGRLASQTKNQGRLRFRRQPDTGDAAGCKLQNRRHRNIKWNSNWMKCPLPPHPTSDCYPPSSLFPPCPVLLWSSLHCSAAAVVWATLRNWTRARATTDLQGQAQKTWFLCNENIVLAVPSRRATLQLRRWRSPVGSLSLRESPKDSRLRLGIVQEYSDGLTGGAAAPIRIWAKRMNDHVQ